jgi:protein-S-isoprenylcysteine O-methyltransferase Ste14
LPSLGARGEGWVVVQVALLAAVAAAGALGGRWPEQSRLPRLVGAALLGATGAWLAAAGTRSLGRTITPLPRPHDRAVLKQDGVYARVRHPIYGGVILLAFGWSLLSSPWALIPTAALAMVLSMKSRVEEHWLSERYPDYPDYAKRVRRRFLPYIW